MKLRLRLFGHGQSGRMLRLEVPGRWPRGRAKRFMEIVKEDM